MLKISDSGTATIDRLLDASAALFCDKGYAATTTREIAAALQIQQASLYYHMASKEALLHRLCLSSLRQFLADVPPAIENATSALERIQTLIHTHVTTLLKYQNRNVTMLTEMRALSKRHRAEVEELRRKYSAIVRQVLEDGQAAGVIRSDIPVTYLSLALLNILNWSALWFRRDRALSVDQLAGILSTVYLEGIATARGGEVAPAESRSAKPGRARKSGEAENATVKRLLRAAVGLFSSKGYAATSTREVAALLGMQKASLYYHIEGKEDLLYFICKSSLEQIRNDVDAHIQGVEDPVERMRVLMVAHIESMLRDADEHTTTLAEMHALSKERLKLVLELRDQYESLVRGVLQAGQEAGSLRNDVDVKYLCLIVLGLMNRVLVWYRRGGPLRPNQLGQVLATIFLSGAGARGQS
jgi:TetR/AcrR family transcriptional regulator, cholesterol catabolism regulator